MSAMPADPAPSPLDPVRILAALPESDREPFLAAYRQALADAADPEGFGELLRMLRLWWGHSLMAARPGYAEAQVDRLVELDINPVIVRAAGLGAVAVDALIRLTKEH